MADNLVQLFGDYAADPDGTYAQTPLQGLRAMADTVNFAAGCPDNRCTNYTSEDVINAVHDAQLIVICVGTGLCYCFKSLNFIVCFVGISKLNGQECLSMYKFIECLTQVITW